MAFKRSPRYIHQPKTLAYFEILLEALVIVVVATELSVQSRTNLFPDFHENQAVPRLSSGFTNFILGRWEGSDANAGFTLPSDSIDHGSHSTLLTVGSMVLIMAACAFYLIFTLFLWTNRNWIPPVLHFPDYCPPHFYTLNMIVVLLWAVPCLQAYAVVYLVVSHVGWSAVPLSYSFYWFLALLYSTVMLAPCIFHMTADLKIVEEKTNIHALLGGITLCIAVLLGILSPYVIIFAVALAPAVPALIWAGLVQCISAVFGPAAGFPGCAVLTCLLMIYSSGRMLGFWMRGSNVAWIGNKLWIGGGKDCVKNVFASDPAISTVNNTRNNTAWDPLKRRYGLALDSVIVCVLSCATWSSYVGGTTQAFRSIHVVDVTFDGAFPECFSILLAQAFPGMNGNTTCVYLNNTLPEWETTMGNAGYVITGILAHISTTTLYLSSSAFFLCVIIFWLGMMVKKWCSAGKPVQSSMYERIILHCLNKWSAVMSVAPLSLVKMVLMVYALDFLLPERFYLPGLTACLLCYTAILCWKCVREAVAWTKARCVHRKPEHRPNEQDSLIEVDNGTPTKLYGTTKDAADSCAGSSLSGES